MAVESRTRILVLASVAAGIHLFKRLNPGIQPWEAKMSLGLCQKSREEGGRGLTVVELRVESGDNELRLLSKSAPTVYFVERDCRRARERFEDLLRRPRIHSFFFFFCTRGALTSQRTV